MIRAITKTAILASLLTTSCSGALLSHSKITKSRKSTNLNNQTLVINQQSTPAGACFTMYETELQTLLTASETFSGQLTADQLNALQASNDQITNTKNALGIVDPSTPPCSPLMEKYMVSLRQALNIAMQNATMSQQNQTVALSAATTQAIQYLIDQHAAAGSGMNLTDTGTSLVAGTPDEVMGDLQLGELIALVELGNKAFISTLAHFAAIDIAGAIGTTQNIAKALEKPAPVPPPPVVTPPVVPPPPGGQCPPPPSEAALAEAAKKAFEKLITDALVRFRHAVGVSLIDPNVQYPEISVTTLDQYTDIIAIAMQNAVAQQNQESQAHNAVVAQKITKSLASGSLKVFIPQSGQPGDVSIDVPTAVNPLQTAALIGHSLDELIADINFLMAGYNHAIVMIAKGGADANMPEHAVVPALAPIPDDLGAGNDQDIQNSINTMIIAAQNSVVSQQQSSTAGLAAAQATAAELLK